MKELKKHEIVELEIESLAFGGKGVARLNGFTIFIERGLPGQRVKAKITQKKQNYAEGHILEIITSAPFEITPLCAHFGVCGGCLFQHLDYQEQLTQKHNQVRDSFKHIGGFSVIEVSPTLPSPELYYYRNKMEFSFSNERWLTQDEIKSNPVIDKNFVLGLHVPGYYNKVLNIDHCFLLSERSNQILGFVRNFAIQSKLAPYTTADHSGFWRFLVLRESKHLARMMVNLVTADHSDGNQVIQELARKLTQQFAFITTIVHNINRKKAQIAIGEEEHIIFGAGYIEESLGTKIYRISANSFFQINTFQAEKLYQLVTDWGQFQKNQIIYDLYSGTGGIAIYIAEHVAKVIGFELMPQAIEDARLNCQHNAIKNCYFVPGDLRKNLTEPGQIIKQFGKPSIIIIDPPRSGLHPILPNKIKQLEPQKIIYVSCNPSTLARDVRLLCDNSDFKPVLIQPVDMFPHTAHCEVAVLLQSNKNLPF